jgi:hypothetical protein
MRFFLPISNVSEDCHLLGYFFLRHAFP